MQFKNYKKIKTKIKGKTGTYNLWVANTPKKRRLGLSRIKSIPKYSGMIFVYNNDQPRTFTMKDTYIPLQIIFLDKNYNVVHQEKGMPRQRNSISCSEDCRFVVEIPG